MILSKPKINWTAVAAVGTLLVVVWATYHQGIREWINRPILEYSWFEANNSHLVRQIGVSFEKIRPKEYDGLFITVQLINTGKKTARDTQPILTKVAKKGKDGNWKLKDNWIPIPLQWVLGRGALQRDLVPKRPYLFNLGSFSAAREGKLLITYAMIPKAQPETFEPGEYCFEISTFAVGAETHKKYFYVEFQDFKALPDLSAIKKVEMEDQPPW